jgi:hypothetical protein
MKVVYLGSNYFTQQSNNGSSSDNQSSTSACSNIEVYKPSTSYHKHQLIVTSDYSKLFIALKDFISSSKGIEDDIDSGNIKLISEDPEIIINKATDIHFYKPNTHYNVNDIILAPDLSGLYIVVKEFISKDFSTELHDGYVKPIISILNNLYKQRIVNGVKIGDTVTITLKNPNTVYNRHVFVLKKQDVNAISFDTINYGTFQSEYSYNDKFTIIDVTNNKIMLNTNIPYECTINKDRNIIESEINLRELKYIKQLSILIS